MQFDEARGHVGDTVIYTPVTGEPRRGVIERIVSLPLVLFDDGTRLQVAPNCLELADQPPSEPTLFE